MISFRQADWGDYKEDNKPEAYFHIDEGSVRHGEGGTKPIHWLRPMELVGPQSKRSKYLAALHPFREHGFEYWEPPVPSGTHGRFYDDKSIDEIVETVVLELGSKYNVDVSSDSWPGKPNRLYTIGLRLKDDAEEMPRE